MGSLVSRYTNHLISVRQETVEEHAVQEMIIAENGPELQLVDLLIETAMSEYWRKEGKVSGWHYVQRSENLNHILVIQARLLDDSWK